MKKEGAIRPNLAKCPSTDPLMLTNLSFSEEITRTKICKLCLVSIWCSVLFGPWRLVEKLGVPGVYGAPWCMVPGAPWCLVWCMGVWAPDTAAR